MSVLKVVLREWEKRGPADEPALRGISLAHEPRVVRQAADLGKRLAVTQLQEGLHFESNSWVGRIRLGPVEVTVVPKITGAPFLNLFRYGFGLRDLDLGTLADFASAPEQWPDLLVSQLLVEARELMDRGLARSYVRRHEELGSPRGRFDVGTLARRGGLTTATLPCVHHPRSEDVLVNRVLRAGLELGAGLTSDQRLAIDLRRLAMRLAESARPIPLDHGTFAALDRGASRLTAAYEPVLRLIRLLAQAHGLANLESEQEATSLPGFLFDMNKLFQAVLTRFLHEHLPPDCAVEPEKRLKGAFAWVPGLNPRGHARPPTPRPDLAIRKQGKPAAFLDAKYRDLWERHLPEHMLYQLAIYALAHPSRESTILYATMTPVAREAAIDVLDPTDGSQRGRVRLRPVVLSHLEACVTYRQDRVAARRLALELAFGRAGGGEGRGGGL